MYLTAFPVVPAQAPTGSSRAGRPAAQKPTPTRKHYSRVLLLCLLAGTGQTTQAAVLNFDDLVMNVSGVLNLPTPYHGVLWGTLGDPDLFAWGDVNYAAPGNYGNSYHSPSGDIAASNYAGPVFASMANGAAFDFNGAYFSSYTMYDLLQSDSARTLTLQGFNGANLVNSLTVGLNIGYDWVQANFAGITSLKISSSNGLIPDYATRWMIDDFTYNATPSPVPEPATMTLALLGLGLLGVMRRRPAFLSALTAAQTPRMAAFS